MQGLGTRQKSAPLCLGWGQGTSVERDIFPPLFSPFPGLLAPSFLCSGLLVFSLWGLSSKAAFCCKASQVTCPVSSESRREGLVVYPLLIGPPTASLRFLHFACSLCTVLKWYCCCQSPGSATRGALIYSRSCGPVCYGEGNGNTLQYSCLENPMGRGAW